MNKDDVASESLKQIDRLLDKLVLQTRTAGWALPIAPEPAPAANANDTATTPPEKTTGASILSSLAAGAQSVLPNLPGTNRGSWWGSLLSPIIGGLLGLFKGGDEGPVSSPIPYIRPAQLSMDYAWTGNGEQELVPFDYNSAGKPRPIVTENRPAPAPITIQVQAMDSQSFLDRRDDIAAAVRRALLESHPLNDSLREV
jgi:hypothetical protein